jgi:RNA recognition motif-containing protein
MGATVFVDGLPSRFSAEDLQALFRPWGAVRAIMASPRSGHSLGFGCVQFATAGEADYAISMLNGREVVGRRIRLSMTVPSKPQPEVA